MADFPAPAPGTVTNGPPVSAGLLAYALFGAAAVVALISPDSVAAPLMGIVGIAGRNRRVRGATRRAAPGRIAFAGSWDVLVFVSVGHGWRLVLVTLGLILINSDRDPHLGCRIDLGAVPRDSRLPVVQGPEARPRHVTRRPRQRDAGVQVAALR